LLVDAIFIWFGDRMLFTLTTVKNLENGIWCSKECSAQLSQSPSPFQDAYYRIRKKTQNKQMLLQAITAWNHCSTK